MEERIIKEINVLLTQLFSKMKESGYEWDAEKKELKKIEQKPVPKFKVGDTIRLKKSNAEYIIESISDSRYYGKGFSIPIVGGNRDYELVEQKPAWSEEDREMRMKVLKYLSTRCSVNEYEEAENWLKSLKERVQPLPKQEWSEEDERKMNWIIAILQNSTMRDANMRDANEGAENWLKSLRPQNTWKPSDRELGAILTAIGDERQKSSDVAKDLLNIYQQLKKLSEE